MGIPNDYGVMSIDFFASGPEEMQVVSDFDLPYVLQRRRMRKVKMSRRAREKLLLKLARGDTQSPHLDDKASEEEEEEESEEEWVLGCRGMRKGVN